MRRCTGPLGILLLAMALVVVSTPAQAQLGGLKDKLKKKAEQKVEQKADQKADEVLEGSPEEPAATPTSADEAAPPEPGTETPAAAAKGGTATSEDMKLYTKYDFVPGDKVIFYDDLSGEEVGEFPSRWRLDAGDFEVVKQGPENWILCTDGGSIRPKVAPGPLPPKYTVEMEFYTKGPEFKGHWFYIDWMDADNQRLAELVVKDNQQTSLLMGGDNIANKVLPAKLSAGKHTMRVMATKNSLKCYIDNERIANVPAVEAFQPVCFAVRLDPYLDEPDNPMLIRGVRYAEGGKTLKQQLDEAGRIITHGILFDSGSDRIRAESYKTLADIGQLLTDTPTLRLSIEGHSDSDGADDPNLTLSQKRAASVKGYLVTTYKIDAGRLESKGWGEGKPIDANDTAEGKANNRRVELVKL